MITLILILFVYLFLFNSITTYRLLTSDMYEPTQKIFQSIVVWLLPFLGTAIIAHFLNDEPIILSKKVSKFILILKFLFSPFMIKIKSNLDNSIGNSSAGYSADFASTSGGD